VPLVLLAGALLTGPPAWSQPPPASKEAARFERKGRRAYAKKRYDDAAAAFELAWRADPQPRYLHNLARCYERLGDLARAVEHLERYVAEESDPEERQDGEATLEIARLKLVKTHSRVQVTTRPATAHVELRAGETVVESAAPLVRWLPFGGWTLVVAQEGFTAHEEEIRVREGEPLALVVELRPPGTEGPAVAESAAAEPPQPPASSKPHASKDPAPAAGGSPPGLEGEAAGAGVGWGPLVAGGVALAAAGAGGFFAVRMWGAANDAIEARAGPAWDDAIRRGEDAELGANVALGVAAAALATGAVLWLLEDRGLQGAREAAAVAAPDAAGLGAAVRF